MSEVSTERVATESVNLKALLQCHTAGLQADIHEPCAREVGVSEYYLNLFHAVSRASFGIPHLIWCKWKLHPGGELPNELASLSIRGTISDVLDQPIVSNTIKT